MMRQFYILFAISYYIYNSLAVSDIFTTWTMGSPPMPTNARAQAVGYDPYTGIIHLVSGVHNTEYITYNTITKQMSSVQSLPNGGTSAGWMAPYYVQIHRTLYLYDFFNGPKCIHTFNMETLTWTQCWAQFPSIPEETKTACMTIDSTGRYFYVIPETKSFFFYDSIEKQWYFGPDTIQTAHLFAGCFVFDNKLYYLGGQVCWGQGCPGLRTIEYLDISNMDSLKQNPSLFSWNTMTDFLPTQPEADFVRSVELNNIIYTATGYRYYGDGTDIDVMGIDLENNDVSVLTEIPTRGIGGSLVWDPCQFRLYYFGGFDGADMNTWYYSNQVPGLHLPSKHKMECMLPQFTTTTTTTATTDSSTTVTGTKMAGQQPMDKENTGLSTLELVLICVSVVIVCCTGLCCCCYFGRKYKISRMSDDKQVSLSQLQIDHTENIKLKINEDNEDLNSSVKNWMENIVGLPQYTDNLLLNGYDSFAVVLDITDLRDLEDIGITLKGHQKRIMKQILILKNSPDTNQTANVNVSSWTSKAVSDWNNNDVVKWIQTVHLSPKWLEIAMEAIKNVEFSGKDIVKLQSGKDVNKLLGINNPMLSKRLYQEIKKIKTNTTSGDTGRSNTFKLNIYSKGKHVMIDEPVTKSTTVQTVKELYQSQCNVDANTESIHLHSRKQSLPVHKTLEQVGITDDRHLITVNFEAEGAGAANVSSNHDNEGFAGYTDSWSRSNMGVKVNLGKDLRTVTINKEFIWTTACMTREINGGIHSWIFEVNEYHGEKGVNGWHFLIGIWKKHKINGNHVNYFYSIEANTGYAYVASDGLLADSTKGAAPGKEYGIVLNAQNTPYFIEMIVDLNKRTVSYSINHKNYGIAFRDIQQCTYVAAISFMPYLGRQKVKFISYKRK